MRGSLGGEEGGDEVLSRELARPRDVSDDGKPPELRVREADDLVRVASKEVGVGSHIAADGVCALFSSLSKIFTPLSSAS